MNWVMNDTNLIFSLAQTIVIFVLMFGASFLVHSQFDKIWSHSPIEMSHTINHANFFFYSVRCFLVLMFFFSIVSVLSSQGPRNTLTSNPQIGVPYKSAARVKDISPQHTTSEMDLLGDEMDAIHKEIMEELKNGR